MIKRRREKEDDYIGPAKGWSKFFHRLFLFVTFPLRKPIKFVALLFVLAILYIAPTFFGVKPVDLNSWHLSNLKWSASEVSKKASDAVSQASLPNTIKPVAVEPKTKVIDIKAKTSGRKMFERAKSAPVVVKQEVVEMEQPKPVSAPQTVEQPKPVRAPQTVELPKQEFKREAAKKLDLVYLQQTKTISGKAVVVNANELKVEGIDMFLYGIYVDPYSEKGIEALKYLKDTIAENIVSCEIIAYSKQSIATSICKIGDVNLNKELVEKGFSKNVALN